MTHANNHTAARIFAVGGRRLATTVAVAAAGLFTAAPAAQAADCTQYAMNGEFVARGYDTYGRIGWTVTFTSTGQFPSGPAQVRFDDGGTVAGTVNGAIRGVHMEYTIKWNDKPDNLWNFDGNVSGDGRIHGGVQLKLPNVQRKTRWDSLTPLVCYTPPTSKVAQPITEAPQPGNTTFKPLPPVGVSELAPTE